MGKSKKEGSKKEGSKKKGSKKKKGTKSKGAATAVVDTPAVEPVVKEDTAVPAAAEEHVGTMETPPPVNEAPLASFADEPDDDGAENGGSPEETTPPPVLSDTTNPDSTEIEEEHGGATESSRERPEQHQQNASGGEVPYPPTDYSDDGEGDVDDVEKGNPKDNNNKKQINPNFKDVRDTGKWYVQWLVLARFLLYS